MPAASQRRGAKGNGTMSERKEQDMKYSFQNDYFLMFYIKFFMCKFSQTCFGWTDLGGLMTQGFDEII
jgi:hypothetical protein